MKNHDFDYQRRAITSKLGMCKARLGLKAPALAWLEAAPAF